MLKILLDTNLLIYREEHAVIDEKVLKLTKILYDSNRFRMVIHPLTIEDLRHIKNEKERKIFLNKIKIYEKLDKPPKATSKFNNNVGCSKIPNDIIDNNILYVVYKNCVHYLITNDNKLKKKAKKINLDDRVLNIDQAIELFNNEESKETRTPAFIKIDYLYNIELNDSFFNSLRLDYKDFDEWYITKSRNGKKAYVSYDENGKIGSFLMLKIEDENENYSKFKIPFEKNKRLKISTFKVANTGNKIGEAYIKIILEEAKLNNLNEIYVTVFKKQKELIHLFEEYGFNYKTTKMTERGDSTLEEEFVYVKHMDDDTYPNFDWKNRNVFIVPIRQKYHEMLFPESENKLQLSFGDIKGINSYSNSIKKAYICKSPSKQILNGDILLFYASEQKKAITTIGIVDNVFSNFNSPEELFNMARKRTVYTLEEIKENYSITSKLILFKYYKILDMPITYRELIEKGILKSAPMSIVKIDSENLKEKIRKIIN